jgi:anti-sigma B factor antagonist
MSSSNGMALDRPSGVRAAPPARWRPVPFGCEVSIGDGRVRVAPSGELDLATTPMLERIIRELLRLGFDDLTIDLGRVSYADARPLRLILELDAARRAGELTLRLLPGPKEVQRIFEVTGTLERLPFR